MAVERRWKGPRSYGEGDNVPGDLCGQDDGGRGEGGGGGCGVQGGARIVRGGGGGNVPGVL